MLLRIPDSWSVRSWWRIAQHGKAGRAGQVASESNPGLVDPIPSAAERRISADMGQGAEPQQRRDAVQGGTIGLDMQPAQHPLHSDPLVLAPRPPLPAHHLRVRPRSGGRAQRAGHLPPIDEFERQAMPARQPLQSQPEAREGWMRAGLSLRRTRSPTGA